MKFPNLSLLAVAVTLFLTGIIIPTETSADHGPERMWKRQIKPYFKAHETGMVGQFSVNMESFGRDLRGTVKQIKKQNFDEFFDDEYNLAAIVRKNNKIVYARFDDDKKINSRTPL